MRMGAGRHFLALADTRVLSTIVVSMDRGLDEDLAYVLLGEACRQVGLGTRNARLIRLGSNAVFRLTDSVVVRIARHDAGIVCGRRTVAVARWLESQDYPAARVLRFEQPLTIDGHAVTFWEAVSPIGNEWATLPQIAALLVKLHKLEPPPGLSLPEVAPFARAEARIASSAWLTPENRGVLTDMLTGLRERYARLDWELTTGVIHGDATAGNALRNRDGRAVLVDLDNFAIGHREWDLVLSAAYSDSFGWHTRKEYAEFARAYGYDIMRWPGYPTLRELSEFLMVTWVVTKAGESERAAAEARKRIASLRTGASRRDWDPL